MEDHLLRCWCAVVLVGRWIAAFELLRKLPLDLTRTDFVSKSSRAKIGGVGIVVDSTKKRAHRCIRRRDTLAVSLHVGESAAK